MRGEAMIAWRLLALTAALAPCVLVTAAQAQTTSVAYAYDALGRLVQVTYPNGVSITYQYDAAGNRIEVQSQGGGPSPPPPPPLPANGQIEPWLWLLLN